MEGLEKAIEQIKENMPKLDLRENEPMRNHCSFKVGGAVRAFAVPGDLFEMSKVMFYLHMNGVSPLTLGKCTNVIFPEEGLDIMVISTENLRKLRLGETENTIYAEAGVSLAKLAQFARDNGLSGLEFASGIPGSVGGGVLMNAGAYGGEMKDVVESVVVYYVPTQALTEVRGSDCGFEYRRSGFEKINCAIMGAVFKLTPDDPEAIGARMKEMNEKRTASQPLDMPSAGSAFKRPVGGYAAALIDQCGLKGYTVGGAQISQKAVQRMTTLLSCSTMSAARSMRRHRLPSSRRYASTPRACCLLTTGARGSRPSSTVCSSRQSRMPQTRQPKAATFGRAERFGERIYGFSYHNRPVRRRQEPGRGHNRGSGLLLCG